MTGEQLQLAMEILDTASGLPIGERDGYLSSACAGAEHLQSYVGRLLLRYDQAEAEDFLTRPVLPDPDQKAVGLIGRRIGPYELLRELGSGGMGIVYLAARADDVYKKEVAVKLVLPGMRRGGIIRRFEQERQILAALDCPNIARLLDGGATEEGWPYVVMEYVDGVPITEYCDGRKLDITERLKLFRTVCAAVSYAHQNLIVHRDLKPGNIFVTTDGTVKLLDFGIAKLLGSELQPADLTRTGMLPFTPDYASPEQMRGKAVNTSSDVYSLGVVLYELLTGHRPYRLEQIALYDVAQAVADAEPEAPSAAVNRIVTETDCEEARSPETISATCEGSPDKLRRRLSGDLDNIALKALRKDPDERYASVAQFSEDIERHLTGKPVIAQTPTLAYRASKFVRRRKIGVAFAAFVALTAFAVAFFIVWQWRAGIAQASENYHALYAARMDRAAREREDFNIEGIREAVESFLPRPGEEDLRGFEWYYLWRWYNRDLITLPHGAPVWAANFSEDGSMVYTDGRAGASRTIKVWNAKTGKLMRVLKSGADAANPVLNLIDAGFVVQGVGKQSFKAQELATLAVESSSASAQARSFGSWIG